MLWFVWLLVSSPALAACDAEDCDGDFFTIAQGDCDDEDPDVFPRNQDEFDLDEAFCNDELDNNCDGLYNEGCPAAVDQGTLLGGGACTGGSGIGGAALLLLPVFFRRRVRA